MTDKLKPVRCGCGGEAKIKKVSDDCYAVYCKKCVIHTGHYWHEEDAIEAWNRAMGGTSAEPERKWIPVTEALPKNSGHDWVLGQIRETDSGYLWIPKVVEYRESSDDWFEESIGWLKKNPDHAFEVIAWMPLPKAYRGEHE